MQLIERFEVTGSPISVYTFDGLRGNTDVVYELRYRIVNGNGMSSVYVVRPNGASSPYGYQDLEAADEKIDARKGNDLSGFYCGRASHSGSISFGKILIFAQAGFTRTALTDSLDDAGGAHLGATNLYGMSWDNSNDEIVSLIVSSHTYSDNCFGSGTVLELWRL